jgi:hypothetical protein
VAGPVHAVDEHDVLPAVGVVVEEGATGAKRFRQQLATEGAAVVGERDARTGRDIHQAEAERRQRLCLRRRRQGPGPSELEGATQTGEKRPPIHGRCTSPLRMA